MQRMTAENQPAGVPQAHSGRERRLNRTLVFSGDAASDRSRGQGPRLAGISGISGSGSGTGAGSDRKAVTGIRISGIFHNHLR
jgi:hypothetical protein